MTSEVMDTLLPRLNTDPESIRSCLGAAVGRVRAHRDLLNLVRETSTARHMEE